MPTPARPRRYLDGLPSPGRCLVMGVVNVTPDSFSDGGMWFEPDAAIEHGLMMLEQGADLLDVGGESTRPGAERPSQDEELKRVLPVVRELSRAGAVVSIDTMRAQVAEQAVTAGAVLVNDVSGGLADPDMLARVAGLGTPYVCMHWRGHSTSMQSRAVYDDVVADVIRELSERVDAALAAGIQRGRLAIDPGLGFAKHALHNWELIRRLDDLVVALDLPVLVGASRKAFLGALLADSEGPRPPTGRDAATAAITVLSVQAGAWAVRVHEAAGSVDAVRVMQAVAE